MSKSKDYNGYEVGRIRPPSEAYSLMLRVTRNCSWNRCKFCTLYKDQRFSIRSEEDIIKDIDKLKQQVEIIREAENRTGVVNIRELLKSTRFEDKGDRDALYSAFRWYKSGFESVFLQDGNSIVLKPRQMINVLTHLKKTFPGIKRITTYARSGNLVKVSDEHLKEMASLGLNRIHIGMETGSDNVLKLVNKGTTKEKHILAGQKVKNAGIELSVYFMPGLGGKTFTKENAVETADVVNQVNPDYIRIRTLAVTEQSGLHQDVEERRFQQLTDQEAAEELLLFISELKNINSTLVSDHILNLIEDVEGKLPYSQPDMIKNIQSFLDMSSQQQMVYIAGRRSGLFKTVRDMGDEWLNYQAHETIEHNLITPHNIDTYSKKMMRKFI